MKKKETFYESWKDQSCLNDFDENVGGKKYMTKEQLESENKVEEQQEDSEEDSGSGEDEE